jgi:hypothetical protein
MDAVRWPLAAVTAKFAHLTQTVDRKRHGRGSKAFRGAFQCLRAAPTTDWAIWLVCSGGMLSLAKLKVESCQLSAYLV